VISLKIFARLQKLTAVKSVHHKQPQRGTWIISFMQFNMTAGWIDRNNKGYWKAISGFYC